MPRIAGLHVTRGGKIRRLQPELETALRIVPVEEVSHPNFRTPAAARPAGFQIGEDPGWCTLIVRGVEIEIVEPGEIDARIQPARMPVFDAEVELILRCVRLLPAVEIAIAIRVVDVTRFEYRAAQVQQQRVQGL